MKGLWETAKTILPIIAFLILFQLIVLRKPIDDIKTIAIGILFSIIGLYIFLQGISMGLLNIGNSTGKNLVLLDNKFAVIAFAFCIGYLSTLVEPALRTLAFEVEEISVGAIPNKVLVHAVAVGFGIGMSIGISKILYSIPSKKIIIPMLILACILAIFTPSHFMDIALDSASSTTGPVNIPLNIAIALGLSKMLEHSDPLLNGFGIVGLTSLGAILSVMSLGILTRLNF